MEAAIREAREMPCPVPNSDALDDYGAIRFATKRKGQFNLLIGTRARHYGLTVVTDNVKDFSPMPGVRIENWTDRPEKIRDSTMGWMMKKAFAG
jgi:predicted nucleic acid-binding protein